MKCMICKHGETENGYTTIILEKDGATIVFQKVPALVCDNYVEQYVDSKVTSSLLTEANTLSLSPVKPHNLASLSSLLPAPLSCTCSPNEPLVLHLHKVLYFVKVQILFFLVDSF